MAAITVQYRGPLEELTGVREEALSASTVRDVLRHVKGRYGAQAAKTGKAMLIAIDGESILMRQAFATKLSDGETVLFFPICGGG
ncbi:MAG: MoaD/ThiS family protein [Oscillospiraceae bacterium]|jgi:molybdopterin converting factor small subunit|nr:MoaD/ThiS family protein [Oscillospiraceae bacterium]